MNEHITISADEARLPKNDQVVKSPLPLSDLLSYLTVHIRSKTAFGRTTGTGFFFAFQRKEKNGVVNRMPVIITNKHVIEGSKETTIRLTVEENDRPSNRAIDCVLSDQFGIWINHPDKDVDLCCFPMVPLLEHLAQDGIHPFLRSLSSSQIATDKSLAEVSQLDEATMIGYPDGLWDEVNNQPIFRKGSFATNPSLDYNGQREFVVDIPVYGGSSGSPILVVHDGAWLGRNGLMIGARGTGEVQLVGIVFATFLHDALGKIVSVPIQDVSNEQRVRVPYVQIPNNLGLAIKASRLLELEEALSRIP